MKIVAAFLSLFIIVPANALGFVVGLLLCGFANGLSWAEEFLDSVTGR